MKLKRFDVPYKYYRCTLVGSWAFAVLCIIGVWIAFQIGDKASITFNTIVSVYLTLTLGTLTTLLFLSDRPDFRKKGWLALLVTLVHTAFWIILIILYKNGQIDSDETQPSIYVLPAVFTAVMVGVVVVGIYFYSRGKYVFKRMRKDAAKAFGGKVEDVPADDSAIPLSDVAPTKPARDEKTGIVSL